MDEIIDFTVFCIESYKRAHNITGKEAIKIFNEFDVFGYIKSFYDVLHSTGMEYLVEDIDEFINRRKNVKV